jgi:Na+-transporting methylmalonyl-CoA/oxaloacetate decarboxylase gamma subunit
LSGGDDTYILGVYISVVDLLIVFSGFVVVVLLYLAYEVNRIKKLERKFEKVERILEREERDLERNIGKVMKKKSKRKKGKR